MTTDAIPATPSPADRVRTLRALADPIRLAIVDLLSDQDLSPDAIGSALDVPGNLLAHHLNVLQSAGVITRIGSQNDRRRTYVRLSRSAFDGLLPAPAPIDAARVVFVCTHNSARSVLAEALWRTVSDVPTASAGTRPATRFNPRARSAARRAGLAIPRSGPRALGDVLRPDDMVVSVCDAVNEDLGPLANPRVHWSIPDPSLADTDAAFTHTLDDIRRRVCDLAPRVTYRRHTTPTRRNT